MTHFVALLSVLVLLTLLRRFASVDLRLAERGAAGSGPARLSVARPSFCAGVDAGDATEAPQERLLRAGASALNDAELLAVLSGSTPQTTAALLRDCGPGVARLLEAGPAAFRSFSEPGRANVLAAFEIARRLSQSSVPEREPLRHSADVARYLALRYRILDQEVLGAIYLDDRLRLISIEEIYRGTLNRACVEPRAILRKALLLGASKLSLFHTHPSGDVTPSVEDVAFTRRFAEAALGVGIRLEDHLILGEGDRWTSLRERIFPFVPESTGSLRAA